MTCDAALARLTAWQDGELDENEANRLQAHLADCSHCATADAELRQLAVLAGAWRPDGGEVWDAVRQEIAAPDLAAVLSELHQLRAEVADLRRLLSNRPAVPAPPASGPLFPYTASTKSARLIV